MNPSSRRERTYTRSDSKVEVTGTGARHYDLLMNLITAGTYPIFIRRAVRDMAIQPEDSLLDLGSGTGRNTCLMARYLSDQGRILGLEIGKEMLEQSRRRCRNLPGVAIENRRIEEPLPYQEEFDLVFIAFVLHGLVQEDRLRVVENVHKALKPGGRWHILDWNEFEPEHAPWPMGSLFQRLECPLATDFVRRNWRSLLGEHGFGDFEVHRYYFGSLRLLTARKVG